MDGIALPSRCLYDEVYSLLDPKLMSIVIGLILEGRFALIHLAPPCSSFSRAVNRFMSYALRSFDFPEGLLNLPEAQMLKVELGNVLAEVAVRLAMAQE